MNARTEVSGTTEDGEYFNAVIHSRPGEAWVEWCSPPECFEEVERMLQDGVLNVTPPGSLAERFGWDAED